ncbi:MAG TPA: GIY-YIG nuclease family protein [Candidatus Binataceae bacterium]|nr:GIY-YIG nuclease family protein [Candidatus Binataceae bacterium]
MRESNFYVYIMSSLLRTLYTGVTNNLERRIVEHRKGNKSSSFTARYNVNRLVYFEPLSEIYEAIVREKQIKQLTRKRKIKLIESLNPDWKDLSQEWDRAPLPLSQSDQTGILRAAATRENDTIERARKRRSD